MKDKVLNRAIQIGLSIITAFILYWLACIIPDYQTIKYLTPISMPSVVYSGEYVHYTFRYCKYTDVMPDITKYYVDGVEYKAEETEALIHKGCGEAEISIHIPESLKAGKYHLRVHANYQMNPFVRVQKVIESNEFTIKDARATNG